jgi:hypothetical protein
VTIALEDQRERREGFTFRPSCISRTPLQNRFAEFEFSCAGNHIQQINLARTIPSPPFQRRWDRQLWVMHETKLSAALGNPPNKRHIWQVKKCQGCNEAPQSICPATHSILRNDYHLPAMMWLTRGYARCNHITVFSDCLCSQSCMDLPSILELGHIPELPIPSLLKKLKTPHTHP